MNLPSTLRRALALLALALPLLAPAQEATIRKALTERIPGLSGIDEISKSPMPGLFEVRIGNDIFYTDPEGNYLIQGALIDTRARKNLTEERINKLTAIDFKDLQLKNAFTVVRGNGKRKVAVFEDPNCPYCKRFEKDLEKIDNVTVHTFLVPILGADSTEKSRRIWCASDKAKTWDDWMLRNVAPKEAGAKCDTAALDANVAFARKYNITGTPTLVFVDGHRVPGAINTQQIEQLLAR
ncbi:DsbC family protein [Ottowia sp.]|uniref:DsbC family protein n=1 Tax=Ottowia sp. TaxID=1898956 RepID=UPI002CAECCE9|nr:DsbC family protein [Pseudomonadota bacterium]HOV20647.1 DsbC family protein [Ottowia sp.]